MFASIGMAGSVILFVFIGLLFVILAAYLVALAARAYMVTAQGTAAGLDEVEWPDEPVYDWLRQSAYLLSMLLLWIMPAGFLARGLAGAWLPHDGPLRFTILIGLAVWLLFPVGILASQRADAIVRLLAHLPYLLGFYLVTGVLLAGCLGLLYLGLLAEGWWAVPFAAVLGSAGLLVHARLLGRLGWLIAREDLPAARPAGKRKKKRKRVRAEASDPWAVPEEATEPPRPPRPSYEEEPPDPYAVAEAGPEPPAAPPTSQAGLRHEEIKREVALRTRKPPPAPSSVLFAGVWGFPFYAKSRKTLAWLGCGSLAVLWLARVLLALFPG